MMAISSVRENMQVIGSDGGMVGVVDGIEGDRIKLKREAGQGPHHFIPGEWVTRVDDHVHLDREAALVRDTWIAEDVGAPAAGAGTAGTAAATGGTPHQSEGRGLLPWIVGGIFLLAILFLLMRGCRYAAEETGPVENASAVTEGAGGADGTPAETATATGVASEVQTYLASAEAAPRSFTFAQLNFDTGSADIRPQDKGEIDELGQVLAVHPNSRMRIVGFTDARGDAGANAGLGQRRAEAVAAGLTAGGIGPGRIEATSGGEAQPAASNASTSGQFQNRRTEIVILSR